MADKTRIFQFVGQVCPTDKPASNKNDDPAEIIFKDNGILLLFILYLVVLLIVLNIK